MKKSFNRFVEEFEDHIQGYAEKNELCFDEAAEHLYDQYEESYHYVQGDYDAN